jgi:hypothetical protein
MPHRVQTMRGPNAGTGTSSDHGSALKIVRWWHCLIVDFGVGVVGVVGAGVQVLLAAEFEQLDAVVGADLVSEIVEECTRFERAGSRP